MSTTARKARKREHRAALAELAEAKQNVNRSKGSRLRVMHAGLEVARTEFKHPAKVATPFVSRIGFFERPAAKVVRDLYARGIKITAKMRKDIDTADKGRRARIRASGGYVRNYSQ